ncbi:odorant receptor Or2-like [Phymastichus coffea]|uniref:odorant receptor Or2-like n=1 Tax=Phymastichus coffea TaxID=108790 RepID=UPI00273C1A81|nr:odorant receptor Or2-like [Phymastichus coffea]XP_058790812.1 odorant receptor Or2-like [Phymastichus coffea]
MKMEAKLATYKTFQHRVGRWMLYCGVRPHQGGIHPSRIAAIYGLFLSVVLFAKVFFYCVANVGNLLKLINGVTFVFSFGTIILKMSVCLICREDFAILEEQLGQKFERELEKKENRPALLEKITVYTRFMYVVATLLFVSISMYVIVPTVNIFKYKRYLLVFMGKYPFPLASATPLYWVIYLFEMTNVYFIWNVTNGVDNAFGLYCFQTCGLLRLGSQRLTDMQSSDPNYKEQLRECVKMHQLVLTARDSLQRAYGVTVIWINITNSIVMCALMWQANQMKNVMTSSRALHFMGFVCLKLMQSFTYAYYGSLVSEVNENYQNAIYMSNWPGSGNVRLMKDLLFILMQRTVTLKACGYFSITMAMFEKIVNTTISYFFLLQTIEAKK